MPRPTQTGHFVYPAAPWAAAIGHWCAGKEQNMDEAILSAVSSVGFPIAVSCYLLIKFQATLDRFSTKMDELILELRRGCSNAPK